MSYLLGQMEATRIIGGKLREVGLKAASSIHIPDDAAAIVAHTLASLGVAFEAAADEMAKRMREQAGEGTDGSR